MSQGSGGFAFDDAYSSDGSGLGFLTTQNRQKICHRENRDRLRDGHAEDEQTSAYEPQDSNGAATECEEAR